jgi:hypothetical protein
VFHALRGNHDEPVSVYMARVQDHKDGKTKGKPGPSLGIAVRMWPTPKASAAGADFAKLKRSKTGLSLQTAARLSVAQDAAGETGGSLNPKWVEWLMGFPIGWTDCGASETPSCPKSPK